MGLLSSKLRDTAGNDGRRGLTYWCQGCEELHHIYVEGPSPVWGWNGDVERPTFTPSVLVRSGHYMAEHTPGKPCWCTWAADHPDEAEDGFKCGVCHTFITDGRVQFLGDCTHKFSGQSLELPDLPEAYR